MNRLQIAGSQWYLCHANKIFFLVRSARKPVTVRTSVSSRHSTPEKKKPFEWSHPVVLTEYLFYYNMFFRQHN